VRQEGEEGSRHGTDDTPRDPEAEEALEWFLRLQEERDPVTLAAFERWRGTDPRRDELFGQFVRLQRMPALRRATEHDAKRSGIFQGVPVFSRHNREKANRWISALTALAATAVIAVAWHQYPVLLLHWRADHYTAIGEHKTFALADGSLVMLNTGSAIATDFKAGRRHVTILEGEAFFDVKDDPAHPFIVTGRFSNVTVRGTAFDVRSAGEEDVVVLERGSLDVNGTSPSMDYARLRPDQMIVANASGLLPLQNADIAQVLAWRDGRVIFHDRPFLKALGDLKRYYPGTVINMAAPLSSPMVSGNYRINDPEAAIRTLATSAGLSVTGFPGSVLILR